MSMLKTGLTLLVAFIFIMAGGNKVTDQIHKDTHDTLAKDCTENWGPFFKKIAVETFKAPPEAIKMLIDDGSGTYKTMIFNIGVLELNCVVLLFSPLKTLSLVLLACTMAGASYMHFAFNDGKLPVTGTIFCLIILILLPSQKPPASAGKKKTKEL